MRRSSVLASVLTALGILGFSLPTGTPSAAPSPFAADKLLENQWYLKSQAEEAAGINVRNAWPLSTGAGVVIGVLDDGLQWAHPDLSPNYLASASWDFASNDSDPQPFPWEPHGTAVIGVAAARGDNGIGVAGVAPEASWAGLRLTATGTDAQKAAALGYLPDGIDILGGGWNPSGNGATLEAPGSLTQAARQSAVVNGRKGKGRVFVWPSGDGRQNSDDCNYDGYANSRYVMAVGSVTDAANLASFSEGCAALFVVGPSGGGSRGITTTDLMGTAGYNSSDYTSAFGSPTTASAASAVAGTVALMLARNPTLGWRDVQHILRRTAVNRWPGFSGWTSGRYPHHENFGFGLVDAAAAVAMAGTWTNVPAEAVLAPATRTVNLPIPEGGTTGVTDTITISTSESNFVVEHVEVDFTATHPWRGEVEVKLISPSGEVSRLSRYRPLDTGDDFSNWQFTSVRHWGEAAAGVWQLNVSDVRLNDSGTWKKWTLRLYGYRDSVSLPGAFSKAAPANGASGQSTAPTLSWGSSSGATSYEYCIDTSNNNACNTSWVSVGSATSKALSGLATGTTYYWHVRANGAGGTTYANGGASAFWSFSTQGAAPGAFLKASPSNGAAELSSSLTLVWGGSSGATSYEYCIDTSNNGACNASWISVGGATSQALTGLAPGTTFSWQVRALNAAGTTYANGGASAFWAFSTTAAPGSFAKNSPANGASAQSSSPTLTWQASSGAGGYEYCIDTSNNGACDTGWQSTGGQTGTVLSGLAPGTTYYWQVRATNVVGTTYANGGATAFWSFTTLAPPGAFTKASPSNGAAELSSSQTLVWGGSSGATSYEYCVDTSNNGACNTSWISVGGATTKALTGLAPGTTYSWQVRALNAAGITYANGSISTFWGFSTMAEPGSFSKSTPANGASGQSSSPTLTWQASTGSGGYEYCIDTSNNGACDTGWQSAGGQTGTVLSGLAAGTTYYWQVRATNAAGTTYANGGATAFWSFITLAPPGAFNKISPANAITSQPVSPTLTWSASAGAVSYDYCVDTTNDETCDAAWTPVGGATSAVVNGLAAGTTYYWRVRATNAAGTTYAQGSPVAAWQFTTVDLLPFVVGQGPMAGSGGWLEIFRGQSAGFAPGAWLSVPWAAYNATGGEVHPAFGDVDGDGRDEVVLGLGAGGAGWIAVLDDAAQDYALLKWVQVQWVSYNRDRGEVFPAVADLDGNGKAEIVAGLGPGGQGWLEIFGDAGANYAHKAWKQIAWSAYNAGVGATHPAAADVDGDGRAEIVVGLGTNGGGWLEVFDDAGAGYSHLRWLQVGWSSYNAANGTTYPAAGDVDGDGKAEVVVGLGAGGYGWVEVFEDASKSFSHLAWLQASWPSYNAASGEVHPAVGNVDGDAAAEVALGFAFNSGNGGWVEVRDHAGQNFSSLGWLRFNWPAFNAMGGATWPAIGKLPPGLPAPPTEYQNRN